MNFDEGFSKEFSSLLSVIWEDKGDKKFIKSFQRRILNRFPMVTYWLNPSDVSNLSDTISVSCFKAFRKIFQIHNDFSKDFSRTLKISESQESFSIKMST